MQSDTLNNKENGNKKGACMDMIDDTDNNTTATIPFENLQQQHSSDHSEHLLDTVQQQLSDISLQDPPAPDEVPLNLYKTEICRNWEEQRTCRYGNRCQYAHGNHDLRYVQRHPRYKTIHCKTFKSTGVCPYGRRCNFLHDQKLRSDRSSRDRQLLEQGPPALTSGHFSSGRSPPHLFGSASSTSGTTVPSIHLMHLEGNKATQDQTITPYSPPMEFTLTPHTKISPPTPLPLPSYAFLPTTQFSQQSFTYLRHYPQYPQQGPNKLDQGKQPPPPPPLSSSSHVDPYQHQCHHRQYHYQSLKSPYFSNQAINVTQSETHLTKDLFTGSGGFSCALGLSPPLPSPSNSNMPSTSYFSSHLSPSSSTATVSSSSSSTSATSPTSFTNQKHPFFH